MLEQIQNWPWALILGVLLAISELLAVIPAVKANSVYQAIAGALVWAKQKLLPAPPKE